MKSEKLNTGEYLIVLDKITDVPFIIGYAFDKDVWKIYKSSERGGHYIIKEFAEEDKAYDYFYGFILNTHKKLMNE